MYKCTNQGFKKNTGHTTEAIDTLKAECPKEVLSTANTIMQCTLCVLGYSINPNVLNTISSKKQTSETVLVYDDKKATAAL